ncbi:hypothetical protein MUP35_00765 [Patescibacteria group bacterium]|nr:hypothetical protein [Patescibacteria group bacterium]
MLNSQPYRELSHSAAKALPFFIGKVKLPYNDPARYNNEFSFSYREGKRQGFAPSTFHKIICELIEKGFIDPVDKGGLRSDGKSYNLFKLSRRWGNYGKPDFERLNWKCFQPRLRTKATSKNENYSIKKGNDKTFNNDKFSQIEAVRVIKQ